MKLVIAAGLLFASVTGALAANEPSTFQNSCSNFGFAFLGEEAGIVATCMRTNGAPNQTSITISGISNRDGVLTYSGGGSTFQRTCGYIRVLSQGDAVILHARCRNLAGHVQSTSIEIKGITNQNGELSN